jgi:hypothetical protein
MGLFTNILKKSVTIGKKAAPKLKKTARAVYKNPKKSIGAGVLIGAGGVTAYSAGEAAISGTNFVDELGDNFNDTVDVITDTTGDIVGGVVGDSLQLIGTTLGLDADTIQFFRDNFKNIVQVLLMFYLYITFGILGLILVFIIVMLYKNKENPTLIKLKNTLLDKDEPFMNKEYPIIPPIL